MKKTKPTVFLVMVALFTAMSVVLNTVADINFITYKITFSYLPAFLAGAFFGPLAGGLVGGLGDLIGCFLNPQGPINPFILTGSVLLGVIPGFVFLIPKLPVWTKTLLSFVLVFLLCSLGINALGIYLYFYGGDLPFHLYAPTRAAKQGPILLVNMLLAYPLYYLVQSTLPKSLRKAAPAKKSEAVAASAAPEPLTQETAAQETLKDIANP